MNEVVYKLMKKTGGASIAFGVITIVVSVTIGTLSIINGAKLLSEKKNIVF